MERKREKIDYGFKAYTGKVWCDMHVDSYNVIQKQINGFIESGLPVPEYLIYSSHRMMVDYSAIY